MCSIDRAWNFDDMMGQAVEQNQEKIFLYFIWMRVIVSSKYPTFIYRLYFSRYKTEMKAYNKKLVSSEL